MRLVRNVAYISAALIGMGLLLYFVLGMVFLASVGGFQGPRSSLPSPMRLSAGATYAVTRECPVTLLTTDTFIPGTWLARIRNGTLDGDETHFYQVGKRIACQNLSGRGIEVTIDAIDADGVRLAFAWAGH